MTREQLIDALATKMWFGGIGNKKGGRIFAERFVDWMIRQGLVNLKESE